jgi:carbon-monoxide dehydrogenase small subunit
MKTPVEINLNGVLISARISAEATLLEFIRKHSGIKSVHRSCEEGECGACTVLIDGDPVCACLTLAVQADGCDILTLEGLIKGKNTHPLIQSFLDNHAIQCGYCSPGMIMTAYALINSSNDLSDVGIRKALEGNLCRCTGYVNIIKAIKEAIGILKLNAAGWQKVGDP